MYQASASLGTPMLTSPPHPGDVADILVQIYPSEYSKLILNMSIHVDMQTLVTWYVLNDIATQIQALVRMYVLNDIAT